MYFKSLHDALLMAGHGPYVWASFVIGFVVITSLIIYPIYKKQKCLSAIKRQYLFDQEES